jgi:hypothetical protein
MVLLGLRGHKIVQLDTGYTLSRFEGFDRSSRFPLDMVSVSRWPVDNKSLQGTGLPH